MTPEQRAEHQARKRESYRRRTEAARRAAACTVCGGPLPGRRTKVCGDECKRQRDYDMKRRIPVDVEKLGNTLFSRGPNGEIIMERVGSNRKNKTKQHDGKKVAA